MAERRKTRRTVPNHQTTAGSQESRDTGSAVDRGESPKSPAQPGGRGRQAYDRGGKKPREFRRSGQIHSDVQDRIE